MNPFGSFIQLPGAFKCSVFFIIRASCLSFNISIYLLCAYYAAIHYAIQIGRMQSILPGEKDSLRES